MRRLKADQIHYLSNRLGECIPERLGKQYIDWWTTIDGRECSHLVEVTTPAGQRIGALFVEEFAHADSPDQMEREWAQSTNTGNSQQVLVLLDELAQKLRAKGFITGVFEKTGPFDRHELAGFVPYPQRRPDAKDWLAIMYHKPETQDQGGQ